MDVLYQLCVILIVHQRAECFAPVPWPQCQAQLGAWTAQAVAWDDRTRARLNVLAGCRPVEKVTHVN